MSKARRIRRKESRLAEKHMSFLAEILSGFYEFLEQKAKPSDKQVRGEFLTREKSWRAYCKNNQLTENASLLFNKEVAQSWKIRYAKQSQTLN